MRYAIISDIHEDIVSLTKVMTQINELNVDKVVCLGDTTGFSDMHHLHKETKDAEACINLLKSECDIIVAGNHDLNTLDRLPGYLLRHIDANSFLPRETWAYEGEVHAVMSNESVKFLRSIPEFHIESTENCRILFSHFLYPDLTGSTIMIPKIKKELKPHFNYMTNNDCLLSFVGHSHIDGFALTGGNFVMFKDFGFKKISNKQQVIFCPALVKDEDKSGFVIFDSNTFELSVKKNNNY